MVKSDEIAQSPQELRDEADQVDNRHRADDRASKTRKRPAGQVKADNRHRRREERETMCRLYTTNGVLWTRLCARTGTAGARAAGDARGVNGHVLKSRLRSERRGPKDTPVHRRSERVCRLCGGPMRRLDERGRCALCLIEIGRGERRDPLYDK